MKCTFFSLLLIMVSIVPAAAQAPAQTVPAFKLYRLDESVFTEKDLQRNKMLFFLFFDADCEHCRHAMMNMNQHYRDYEKAAVYLISSNDVKQIKGFVAAYATSLKQHPGVTLLHDTKNEFLEKFRPMRYPAMFLYSSKRMLIDYEDNEESMFRFLKPLNAPLK